MDEIENAAVMSDDSSAASFALPRLGIRHVMLWTLCTCGCLGWYLMLVRMSEEPSFAADHRPAFTPARALAWMAGSAGTGAVLAGTCILAYKSVQRGAGAWNEPGHWMLLSQGADFLLSAPLHLLQALFRDEQFATRGWFFLDYGAFQVVPLVLYAVGAIVSTSRLWKCVFATLAFATALKGFENISVFIALGSIYSYKDWIDWVNELNLCLVYGDALVALRAVGVAVVELRFGRKRDWLHWTGVATLVLAGCLPVANTMVRTLGLD